MRRLAVDAGDDWANDDVAGGVVERFNMATGNWVVFPRARGMMMIGMAFALPREYWGSKVVFSECLQAVNLLLEEDILRNRKRTRCVDAAIAKAATYEKCMLMLVYMIQKSESEV